MPNSSLTIIGIDPGVAITGYGLIQGKFGSSTLTVLEYGTIRTPAHTDLSQRLCQIYQDLSALLDKYQPDYAGCEKLFFSKNVKTGIDVGQARGVLLLALAQHHIPITEITPLQVKQSITGYGSAEKKQVQYMTQQILQLKKSPTQDDAADALGIAIATHSLLRTTTI
jgi:crossover junction endodeoxyribonuclease RuvC